MDNLYHYLYYRFYTTMVGKDKNISDDNYKYHSWGAVGKIYTIQIMSLAILLLMIYEFYPSTLFKEISDLSVNYKFLTGLSCASLALFQIRYFNKNNRCEKIVRYYQNKLNEEPAEVKRQAFFFTILWILPVAMFLSFVWIIFLLK